MRRRNLAVSFGILLALAMLVVWTQRAERLAKLQVDFVAGVSHELRTPLAVISSAADNLAAGVVDVKRHVQQYGTLIGSEAHRLSDMVQQILLFAAAKAGRVRYEVRPVEIGEMIDRALSETSAMINEAGFAVEKHIQPDLPPVLADASALIQRLENLITNAVKYGRDNERRTDAKNRVDLITMTVYDSRYMSPEMNVVTREVLLGFWKVHILHHATEGPIYGQWMMSELRRHGYEISPGTLYPLLQRMERHGWLKRARSKGTGPRARKNYLLTEEGRRVLRLLRKQLEEMHREVVREARGLPR